MMNRNQVQPPLVKSLQALTLGACLLLSAGALAEESQPVSQSVSEGTKDFLSDPAHAGVLVGTVVAGAAIANPLAPLVGGVAGFFIGKKTDYSEKAENQSRRAFARRSLVNEDRTQVATLPGLTTAAGFDSASEVASLDIAASSSSIGEVQQQFERECKHISVTTPTPVYCYYFSQ